MAQKVQIEFEGGGGMLADLDALFETVNGLGATHKRVQEGIRSDLDKTAAETRDFNKDIGTTVRVVTELGKAGSAAASGGLSRGLKDASGAARTLQTEVDKVRSITGAAEDTTEALGKTARQAGTNATRGLQEVANAARNTQQQIAGSVRLTAEQYAIIEEELKAAGLEGQGLVDVFAEVVAEAAAAGVEVGQLDEEILPAEKSVESLQRQLRAAKLEAGQLAAEFGLDSEQALAAQRRVAELADEVGDLKDRFDAFNPDAKFEAFNRLSFSVAAGLGAVQGVFGLIAGENSRLQQTLFTLQSVLFATQGLQQFFGGFGDSLKTLRAVIAGTTATTAANTAANATNAASLTATGAAATASAGGFATLTTSVRAFLASLLTNPIFLAVAAIAALGVALLDTGDEAERLTRRFDGLRDSILTLQEFSDASSDLKAELAALDLERRKLNIPDGDFKAQAAAAREQAAIELQALREKERIRRENVAGLERELAALRDNSDVTQEEFEQRNAEIGRLEQEANALRSDQTRVRERTNLELARIDKAAVEAARAAVRERKALQEDVLAAELELAERLRQARLQRAGEDDPRLRVELEREAADREIDELERGFLRKIALVRLQARIGSEAFRELSEAERNARADALIEQEDITLPARQQEQVNNLRLIAEQNYLDAVGELYQEQEQARLELIADVNERERAEFRLTLRAKLDDLRKAGADEQAIREFAARETEAFNRQQALAAIDLDEQLNTAVLGAKRSNGEIEKVFERRKQAELLQIQIQAAEARLRVLEGAGDDESRLLRAQIQETLAGLRDAERELQDQPLGINLLDLLGIRPEDQAQVQQSLQQFASSLVSILNTVFDAQQQQVQAQIDATDAIIEDAQRRRSELETQLTAEVELQRRGLASNVGNVRQALQETRRAEEEAVARQRQLQQEQERIARRQAAIQAIVQTANIASAAAQVISANSGTIPTLIAALAAAAALVATFASIKADAASVSKRSYRHGGFLEGPSHEAGGLGIYDERTGERVAEAEGGEGFFFVNKATTSKRRKVLEALNDDDMGMVAQRAIEGLAASSGVRLEPDTVDKVIDSGRQYAITANFTARNDGTAEEVRALRGEVGAIYGYLAEERETVEHTPAGRVIRKGNTKRTIR